MIIEGTQRVKGSRARLAANRLLGSFQNRIRFLGYMDAHAMSSAVAL